MFNNTVLSNFTDLGHMVSPRMRGMNPGRPSFGNTGVTDLVSKELAGPTVRSTILQIKWGLRRFPELKYHIGALATFTSFTNQYPWVNKNVYGPGGISVTAKPRLNQDEALIQIVNDAFKAVKEAGLTGEPLDRMTDIVSTNTEPEALDRQVQADTIVIKELDHKLLSHNDIYPQLYHAAASIVTYSACVVDYSEDYSVIQFYSIDEVEQLGKEQEALPPSAGGLVDAEAKWQVVKTGKLLSKRAQVVTDDDVIENSPIGRIIHYLKIIDLLETALSVERIAKSNSFVVWKVGVDSLPGELVTPWLDVYKEKVMTRLKAGTEGSNMVQASMSKSLTASHIFVPNYKDSPTEVETINLEYRPLLNDLEYWWGKVYMAMGIPPYYASTSTQINISKDISGFHEGLLGSRVRMYQALLEKVLGFWVKKFIEVTMGVDTANKYTIQLFLPTFVSGGEEGRSEYMRRVNQFASAYSTLSVSGMPISPDFAVKLMFPNADPQEVVDWQTRKLMNPDSSSPYELTPDASPTEEEQYVDGVLDAMSRGVNIEPEDPTQIPDGLSMTNTDGMEEM